MDKQRLNLSLVSIIIDKQLELGLKYNLSLVSCRDLITITRHYLDTKEAINSYGILIKTNTSGSTYNRLYHRVKLMIKKGLVTNISDEGCNFRLIPTEKAIKEFEKLFSCLDE